MNSIQNAKTTPFWQTYLKVFFAVCFAILVAYVPPPTIFNIERRIDQWKTNHNSDTPYCAKFDCFATSPTPEQQEDQQTGELLMATPFFCFVGLVAVYKRYQIDKTGRKHKE